MAKFKVGDKVQLSDAADAAGSGIEWGTVNNALEKGEMTVTEVKEYFTGEIYYQTNIEVNYGWPEDSIELLEEVETEETEEEKYTIREIASAIGVITGMGKDAVVESQIEQVKEFFAKKAKFQELKEEFLRQQAIYDPQ